MPNEAVKTFFLHLNTIKYYVVHVLFVLLLLPLFTSEKENNDIPRRAREEPMTSFSLSSIVILKEKWKSSCCRLAIYFRLVEVCVYVS